jgi:uncharacterized protein YndB with AHSA1/START domain
MAPIEVSVEVDRSQQAAFDYVTDPSRFHEWQAGVVGGSMEGTGYPDVGAKCSTTRRIGGAEREATSEVTRIDPPHNWGVRGIDGPIRAIVNVDVEPINGGARSRVTITLDFEGHGIGTLLVPLVVRRQAEKEMPANVQRLKQRLEAG